MFVDILTTVSANNENPVASTTFKAMHLVLVPKNGRIRLNLPTLLRPANESILFELF